MARAGMVPEALKHGSFTPAAARAVGIERWHLRSANYKRLARATYVWSGVADARMASLAAALGRLPLGAVFSGATAAWLHGIDVRPGDPIEMSVPRATGIVARAGLRVRRVSNPEGEVVEVRGLPATSIVRTVGDTSRDLALTEAVVVADTALHRHLLTARDLQAWAARHSGDPGIRKVRRVIELAEPASQSQMETRLRMVLILGGLPRPLAQQPIRDEEGRIIGCPDLYYPAARLGIEYDGATHRTSLVDDNRRQNTLFNAGVELMRFTAGDVFSNPSEVVRQVSLALTRRGGRHSH